MKISNLNVYGLNESIVGSAYPMLPKAPSEYVFNQLLFDINADKEFNLENHHVKRAESLGSTKPASGHDQFLSGIIVQFDVDFTIKAWTEAERYHFLDFVSSMSTMHRLTKFDLDEAYIEYVDNRMIDIMKELQEEYNNNQTTENYLKLIYSNPTGMKLTARMTTNYRQLKTIMSQRSQHRLPEWREFCSYMKGNLPMFRELTGIE